MDEANSNTFHMEQPAPVISRKPHARASRIEVLKAKEHRNRRREIPRQIAALQKELAELPTLRDDATRLGVTWTTLRRWIDNV